MTKTKPKIRVTVEEPDNRDEEIRVTVEQLVKRVETHEEAAIEKLNDIRHELSGLREIRLLCQSGLHTSEDFNIAAAKAYRMAVLSVDEELARKDGA
jgi:hypothetical protein